MVLISDDSWFVKRIFMESPQMSCIGGATFEGGRPPGHPPEPDVCRSGSHAFA
jgi:hypothetical protein